MRTGEQSSTVRAHSNGFRLVRELVRTSPVSSFVAQIVTKLFSGRSAGYTDDSLERRNSLKRLLGSHYCEPLAPVTANEQAPPRSPSRRTTRRIRCGGGLLGRAARRYAHRSDAAAHRTIGRCATSSQTAGQRRGQAPAAPKRQWPAIEEVESGAMSESAAEARATRSAVVDAPQNQIESKPAVASMAGSPWRAYLT